MDTRKVGSLWCRVKRSAPGAPLFVAIHGRGGSSADIYLLGNTLCPGCNMLFPDGRLRWPADGQAEGRAWYSRDLSSREREIAQSREALSECIERARAELDAGPVILLGFSQGAVMTLDIGLRSPSPAKLLVALCGFLFEDVGDYASPETLIVNGSEDTVIPAELGRDAHDRLERRGVPVTYRELATDHSIRREMVEEVRGFLRRSRLIPEPPRK